ncbi:MAG: signal peptidase I [Candidatus Woesearchaeota archaeon]
MPSENIQHKESFGRKLKKFAKAVWHFIWEEDSILSWVVNIILAFIIIKFLVYPGLGFVLGTTHPIVAVVSGSMEHDNNFEYWWLSPNCCLNNDCDKKISQAAIYANYGIDESKFVNFPYENGFNKGDIMILYSPKNIAVGDIAVFMADSRLDPIIHRVIGVEMIDGNIFYKTKGDHNCASAEFEKRVPKEKLIGKAVWRVPFLGWIKIGFVELLKLVGLA